MSGHPPTPSPSSSHVITRRTIGILAVAAAVAAPAVVLRALCAGAACDPAAEAPARVPFCSLPGDVRSRVVAGFRDGRSPEVMAVAGPTAVVGADGLDPRDGDLPWPSAQAPSPTVPIVFAGTGVRRGATVPPRTGLEDVAPTVAEILGLRRPHPDVRSGRAIPGVATKDRPRLVVQVVWKGVDGADLRDARGAWPSLARLLDEGAGTLRGRPGSAPLDPAALLTTLGTGGLPSEHGITGTVLRNDEGDVVRAWRRGAPFSVIATLGDDLDHRLRQEPRIGLVATDRSDRGAIGGNWYLRNDRDDVVVGSGAAGRQAEAAEALLGSGYGGDEVPDLLVVVMRDSIRRMDRALARIVDAADDATGGSAAVVVTSVGAPVSAADAMTAERVARGVERGVGADVVEATALGGLFLDQQVLAEGDVLQDDVLRTMRALRDPAGDPVLADAFTGVAVTLARYC